MRVSIFENVEFVGGLVLLNRVRSFKDQPETFAITIDKDIDQNHNKLPQRRKTVIRSCALAYLKMLNCFGYLYS